MTAPNFKAGGTINPSRFVKVSTAADNTALQAGAGDYPIGISTPSQKLPPTPENSGSTQAASSGDPIMIFGLGDICMLTAGSGGFTSGDKLKPDSSGQGITATTGAFFGAIALETAASGALGRVQVVIGTL